MNQRDRLYAQREYIAWGRWKREGGTTPNALGYGSSTPIGSLMSGDIGSGGVAGCKVPTHFKHDDGIDITNKIYNRLDMDVREVVCGIFAAKWSEQFTSDVIGISRRQVRNRLTTAYETLYEALRTVEKGRHVASG